MCAKGLVCEVIGYRSVPAVITAAHGNHLTHEMMNSLAG